MPVTKIIQTVIVVIKRNLVSITLPEKNADLKVSIIGVKGLSQNKDFNCAGTIDAGYTTGVANMNKRKMNCNA